MRTGGCRKVEPDSVISNVSRMSSTSNGRSSVTHERRASNQESESRKMLGGFCVLLALRNTRESRSDNMLPRHVKSSSLLPLGPKRLEAHSRLNFISNWKDEERGVVG